MQKIIEFIKSIKQPWLKIVVVVMLAIGAGIYLFSVTSCAPTFEVSTSGGDTSISTSADSNVETEISVKFTPREK